MKDRRLLVLLTVATGVLALVAAGCGEGDKGGEGGGETVAAEPADPAPEPAPPEPEPSADEPPSQQSPIRVGLVANTGGIDDRGLNELAIAGLDDAAEEFDVEARVFVSESEDDYMGNLVAAAEDSDLVISVGLALAAETIEVAATFPDVFFAGVDQSYGSPGDAACAASGTCATPNALGLVYPAQEGGYLAGIVAAYATQTGTVSTMGSVKSPRVDSWIAGFQQGALSVDSSIELLNAYSEDTDDEAKCEAIAIAQISEGADVVFPAAGRCGLGALDAADAQGVRAIGVESDQSSKGTFVLTSGLKPVRMSVFDTIFQFVEMQLTAGGNMAFSVQDFPDAQLLATLSRDVSLEAQDAVAVAKEQLISGEITPLASVEAVDVTR